ncbi:hypothetical protein QJR28_09505 [Clostridium baratii]|uniref:hypothetical protein n=1 Tax=Clostridium baratii TaxID=1561 RepID=UPI0030D00E3D
MEEKKKKISKKQVIIIAITSIIIIVGVIGGKIYNENKYQKKLIETSIEMLNLGADSEKISNNFISLWDGKISDNFTSNNWTREYMARWIGIDVNTFMNNTTPLEVLDKAHDFNDVLRCYKEYNTRMLINDGLIKRIEKAELDIMELNNPPSKFSKSYDALVKMYTNVSSYVSLATNPTGSLNSYKSDTNALSKNIVSEYNIVKTQIPN